MRDKNIFAFGVWKSRHDDGVSPILFLDTIAEHSSFTEISEFPYSLFHEIENRTKSFRTITSCKGQNIKRMRIRRVSACVHSRFY